MGYRLLVHRILVSASIASVLGISALAAAGPALADSYSEPNVPTTVAVLGQNQTRPAAPAPAPVARVLPGVTVAPASTTKPLAFTGSDAVVGGLGFGAMLLAAGTSLRVAGRRKHT